MKKRKIRVYKTLANVFPGVYNYPVFYLVYEGWSNFSLETCIQCGELFVIDWENPKTAGLEVQDIVQEKRCPICNHLLKETIREYPKTIKLPNGYLGSYQPSAIIPPDNESLILEIEEILVN